MRYTLPTTPLVIGSIGALGDRKVLKLWGWMLGVSLPAWLNIEQWMKASAEELAALESEHYPNELELHLYFRGNVTHN